MVEDIVITLKNKITPPQTLPDGSTNPEATAYDKVTAFINDIDGAVGIAANCAQLSTLVIPSGAGFNSGPIRDAVLKDIDAGGNSKTIADAAQKAGEEQAAAAASGVSTGIFGVVLIIGIIGTSTAAGAKQ